MYHFDPLAADYHQLSGLDPFKSIAVPRPIAWISTVSADGNDNLAPYSQFTNVGFDPPYIMFCAQPTVDGRRKDSVINAEDTGCFVHNFVPYSLKDQMLATAKSSAPDVDEFLEAGLEKLDSLKVAAKRVAASPIHLECEYVTTVRLKGSTPKCHSDLVIGRVVMIHIDEQVITPEGKLDILKLRPLSRLGYADYTSVTELFEMSMQSLKKEPIPGCMGWMSPKTLDEKATYQKL